MDKQALATATKAYRNLGSSALLLAIQDYRGARKDSEDYETAANFLFPRTPAHRERLDWACSLIGIDSIAVMDRLASSRNRWDSSRCMVRNGWKTA